MEKRIRSAFGGERIVAKSAYHIPKNENFMCL
jgi:hypothetical protein